MDIKAYSADLLYTLNGKAIPKGVVEINEEGTITHIGENSSHDSIKVQHKEGFICPGFVNTHCHLELSHLKGKVPEGRQLHNFISDLQSIRASEENDIKAAIVAADEEMKQNGIVAVGDISNSHDSFLVKKQSKIHYHTFVELFGFNSAKAAQIYQRGKQLGEQLKESKLNHSLVPHSPYSMSQELLQMIASTANNSPISIHNQETESENMMFKDKSGELVKMLKNFGNDLDNWKPLNDNSIKSYLPLLPKKTPLLLVHNTFSSQADIEWAEKQHKQLFWCFCPNANLFIENKLPDFNAFIKAKVKCTIGTDSLASNWQLSVWEEIRTIMKHFPKIELETLLYWSCKNGAEFLGIDDLGSLTVGKAPGLVWVNEDELRII